MSLAISVLVVGSRAQSLSNPLSEPSRSSSVETLFEKMPPEKTGIDFVNRYDRPDRWGALWRQYFNGSIGTGVVLGDVNGDTLPDIFLVGKDSPNALYLNRGDFRFENVTIEAGLERKGEMGAGASLADIDNDGDLDIYVCYVGYTNELYLNDGSGRFTENAAAWGLDINTGSNAPSFADYDRDGDLDLYLQCNFLAASGIPEGMPDFLLRNEGDRFVDVTESAGISGNGQGHIALWSDLNEDGWPDVYIANDFEPADKLYLNNQDGTFTDRIKETLEAAPYSAMGADVGDINNDGHMDLLVAEMAPRDRAYRQRTTGPLSGKLFGVDKNGISQYMQNMLSVNFGSGQFAEIGRYAGIEATDWSWSARLVDLDNDGLLDAYFTNGMARAFHDGDLAVRMTRIPTLRGKVALFERSPPLLEQNLAYRNIGDMRFEDVSSNWGLDEKGVSFASAFADFDADGDLDLVVCNWNEAPSVYRNNGNDGNRMSIRLVGKESNTYGVGAKVFATAGDQTQIRELSLMRGYMGGDEPIVSFSFRDAEKIDALRVEWPSGAEQELRNVILGNRITIEEKAGDLEPTAERPKFDLSEVVDVDPTAMEFEFAPIYRDQFMQPFRERQLDPAYSFDALNEDGWSDEDLEKLRQSGRIAVELDVDGDGIEELIIAGEPIPRAYPRSYPNRIYSKNEQGESRALGSVFPEEFSSVQKISSMIGVDIDSDGDMDLITVSQWGTPLIWKSDNGLLEKSTELIGAQSGLGLWNSIAAGDFNGDGRTDLVLGNLGLNTKFKPGEDSPVVLYSSKDNDADPRLFIESETVDGKQYPIESRLFHQVFLPAEMQATGTYEEYVEMTVEEIFPKQVMETLESREIVEVRSLLLLQTPAEDFERRPLPSMAQIGRAIDIKTADIDHDGDLDLVLAVQSISPQPWVARGEDQTRSVVLINNGSGVFESSFR